MQRREESKKTWPGHLFIHSKPQSQSASWLGFFNSTQSYMTYKGCLCRVITTEAISPQKFRFPLSPSCPVLFSHVKNNKSLDGMLIQQLALQPSWPTHIYAARTAFACSSFLEATQPKRANGCCSATWALCALTSDLRLHNPVLY